MLLSSIKKFAIGLWIHIFVLVMSLSALAQPIPAVTPTPVPDSVLVVQSAPVKVDGKVLFYLRRGGQFSAQERAALFNERLRRLVNSGESSTANVRKYGQTFGVQLGPIVFTVTPVDTEEHQMGSEEVAYFWASKLQAAVDGARSVRTPESLRRAYLQIGGSFLICLLGHVFLGLHWKQRAKKSEDAPSAWTLFLLRITLWWAWCYVFVLSLPYTRHLLAPLLKAELVGGFALGTLLFVQFGFSKWLTAPLSELLAQRGGGARVEPRAQAILRFFKGIAGSLILVVALLAILGLLGLSTTPFVASLGLVGLVLGLAVQALVKDVVAGLLILLEDKFGIGDWVDIRGRSGEVIGLSLHVTTLRDLSGDIISIPNGSIDTVVNHTQDWSAIDLKTSVSHDSNIEKALEAMELAGARLRTENPALVLAKPELLGVDSIEETGPVLRMLVRVVPGHQWSLARELRRFLITEFHKVSVQFGRQRLELDSGGETPRANSAESE